MELRTFTSLWQIERRLYRIDDIQLPGSPTYRQIGIFFAVTIPWVALFMILPIPLNSWTFPFLVLPPILITYFANRPIIENKTGFELFMSNSRYIAQSRFYTGLRAFPGESIVTIQNRVWRRTEPPKEPKSRRSLFSKR